MLGKLGLDGFIINIRTEFFLLPASCFEEDAKQLNRYYLDDSYTSGELKWVKGRIDNHWLDEFIRNPKNAARYDGLFEGMSKSKKISILELDL